MNRLEDLQPNASLRGVLPDALVTVVSVQWFGSEALELTYKDAAGKLGSELLYRHDEPRLAIAEQGRPTRSRPSTNRCCRDSPCASCSPMIRGPARPSWRACSSRS